MSPNFCGHCISRTNVRKMVKLYIQLHLDVIWCCYRKFPLNFRILISLVLMHKIPSNLVSNIHIFRKYFDLILALIAYRWCRSVTFSLNFEIFIIFYISGSMAQICTKFDRQDTYLKKNMFIQFVCVSTNKWGCKQHFYFLQHTQE